MNPRYIAYARENGNIAADQLAIDSKRWPGGRMAGFMLWISGKLQAFRKAHPECFMPGACGALVDHAAFDAFIGAAFEGPSWAPSFNRWHDQGIWHLEKQGRPACGVRVYMLGASYPGTDQTIGARCQRCEAIAAKQAAAKPA